MTKESVFNNIREWAANRGIYSSGDAITQFVKLQEEVGELAQAILKNNILDQRDALGDCVVVLTNLAYFANINIELIDFETFKNSFKPTVSVNFVEAKFKMVLLSHSLSNLSNQVLYGPGPYKKSHILHVLNAFALISHSLNHNLLECTLEAYKIISDRTGKMIGGTFIKD